MFECLCYYRMYYRRDGPYRLLQAGWQWISLQCKFYKMYLSWQHALELVLTSQQLMLS